MPEPKNTNRPPIPFTDRRRFDDQGKQVREAEPPTQKTSDRIAPQPCKRWIHGIDLLLRFRDVIRAIYTDAEQVKEQALMRRFEELDLAIKKAGEELERVSRRRDAELWRKVDAGLVEAKTKT